MKKLNYGWILSILGIGLVYASNLTICSANWTWFFILPMVLCGLFTTVAHIVMFALGIILLIIGVLKIAGISIVELINNVIRIF